jgi:hypothetical protein
MRRLILAVTRCFPAEGRRASSSHLVADLDVTRRALKDNGVDFEVAGAVLLVPPAASHGLALEFIEQETI